MKPLIRRLEELKREIRVSVIGTGSIGNGLVQQLVHTPGMRPVAIADQVLDKAVKCAQHLGLDYVVVDTLDELHDTIQKGKLAIAENGELVAQCSEVDAMVEASNALYAGAQHALRAIEAGKHVVMMNFEAELMFGPYLLKAAKAGDVVYTCADGDQPTVIKKLIDDIQLWGFDLVMAGNIKGYLDRYTDPTKIIPEADKRNLDHKMCSAYTDGSKLCVEMAVLANAMNLRTARPGMFGPKADSVHEIFDLIDIDAVYKEHGPVVEFLVGAEPKGGVFVIGYTGDTFQQYTLDWFPPDMGPGPYYLFYRPYHLGHIEAMECIAEAVLDRSYRLQPTHGMKTNVYSYVKRELKTGDILDGMGGYQSYGLIENLEDNLIEPGIPICIAENCTLKRGVAKGKKILLSDVEVPNDDPAFDLYYKSLAIDWNNMRRHTVEDRHEGKKRASA